MSNLAMGVVCVQQLLTLSIAVVTAVVAWRTFRIQNKMDARDLAYRKERARLAVTILCRGMNLIVITLAGSGEGDVARHYGARWDVLEDLRRDFDQLAWIPDCGWKLTFEEMMTAALPKDSLGSSVRLDQNVRTLQKTSGTLSRDQPLYLECMATIDRMV